MNHAWFVTGTDTNVGKTLVSCALLHALRARGLSAVGMKPVASGCRMTPDGARHADAEALLAASSVALDYAAINPYALLVATAPHLAAQAEGVAISLETITQAFARKCKRAPRWWWWRAWAGGWCRLTPATAWPRSRHVCSYRWC